jgi:hypothetical protein
MPLATPRMAPANSLHTKPSAFENAVRQDSIFGILRTRRGKATSTRQEWRDGVLVNDYRQNEKLTKNLAHTM